MMPDEKRGAVEIGAKQLAINLQQPGHWRVIRGKKSSFGNLQVFSFVHLNSPAEKVSAEKLSITPLQQRDRRERQIPLGLARANYYGLNRAAIGP